MCRSGLPRLEQNRRCAINGYSGSTNFNPDTITITVCHGQSVPLTLLNAIAAAIRDGHIDALAHKHGPTCNCNAEFDSDPDPVLLD